MYVFRTFVLTRLQYVVLFTYARKGSSANVNMSQNENVFLMSTYAWQSGIIAYKLFDQSFTCHYYLLSKLYRGTIGDPGNPEKSGIRVSKV